MPPQTALLPPPTAVTNLTSNNIITSGSSNTASFIHRTVRFSITDLQLSKRLNQIHCNRKHLINAVLQCREGTLHCRSCHPKPNQSSPNTLPPCHEHGLPVYYDRCETRALLNFRLTCPSNTTFGNKPDNACPWEGDFRLLGTHLDQCQHMPLATRVTIQDERIIELEQEKENRNRKLDQLTQKLDELCNQLHPFGESSRTATVAEAETQLDRRMNSFEEDVSEKIRGIEERVREKQIQLDQLQYKTRKLEDQNLSMQLKMLSMQDQIDAISEDKKLSRNGTLMWKIDNYQRRRSDAVTGQQISFYSSPFLSSEYGYKLCARFYLNGEGTGRGTHVSLHLVVMRGDYDAILNWPFLQKVTFMILDQDNVEHAIKSFGPDPQSSSFQRPRRETNISTGISRFLSLTDLYKHAYVKDDTMFVKIHVTD